MIAVSEHGFYQQGTTRLHRADPRVKFLACLVLVVLAFAASNWLQLAAIGGIVAAALWLTAAQAGALWRLVWMLRWLLLFTLLMHLLLSPGRTLWGTSWLSYDGLLTGLMVCAQVLLALATSALLAITTATEDLVRAFDWVVTPLRWLGCRTREWQKLLLLTMDFIPAIQHEMRAAGDDAAGRAEAPGSAGGGLWSVWLQKFNGLLWRLVDRGDVIAHRLAADEDAFVLPLPLAPLVPMALLDQIFSGAMVLMILCYWLLG